MASCRFLVVVSGAEIYVAANPLRSDRRKRTKDSIAAVRHLYLDFAIDGEARLASLRTSDTVPTPTTVLSTSLCKYQTLCRIDSFTFEQQESTLKLLAIPFGGEPASMGCNRVLRMPGFRNCENDPPYPVTVKYACDSTSNPASTPGDFRLDIPAANALPLPHVISSRKHPGKHTNSEHDWARILHEFAHRKDAAKPTRALASRRSDKRKTSLLRPANGQCRIAQILPQRRRSDGGRFSRCWRFVAVRDCRCAVYPKRHKQGCGGAACEEAYSWGGVRGFCPGVEGVILHSILWQCRNGASHRKNLDTPPLRGCCRALRGAAERPVQNE
jgi:RepB DNA-primase from phage plasmid